MPEPKTDAKVEWFCTECNIYGTLSQMKEQHHAFGHLIKKRTPIQQRIIHTTKGNITVTVDGVKYWVVPILQIFKNPLANIEGLRFPELTLQNVTERLERVGIAKLDGNLTNVTKKLSMEAKITPSQLKQIFINAIKQRKYVEGNGNVAFIHLCLNTDLKLQPKNESSKWVAITPSQLKRILPDEEEHYRKIRERAKLYTRTNDLNV